MPWWGWIILGALLFGSELLLIDVAFYLVFLGLAAILVGLVGLFGMTLPLWGQWLLFAALAALSMPLFRKRLYQKVRAGGVGYKEGLSGDLIEMPQALAAGQSCRVTYRGTGWTLINRTAATLEQGQHIAISRVEGLTLIVESVQNNS